MSAACDHRPAQSAVRDQGHRYACVGFAVAAAHEWMSGLETRSVEDVIWAGHQIGGDPNTEATSVGWALAGLDREGHLSEATWPYNAPPWPAPRPSTDSAIDIPGFSRLASLTFDEVADTAARGAAALLTLGHVPGAWQKAAPDGRVHAEAGRKIVGRHAVLCVGMADEAGDRSLICKNSWGPAWGAAGYAFISESYIDAYLVAAHVLEPGVNP